MSRHAALSGHLKATAALGLPLIGSQLSQFVVQLTDVLMMGWYGVTELAAVVVAGNLLVTLVVMGTGFAWAVMPLVAAAAEAGDEAQVRRVTRMGLWVSVGFAALVLPPLLLVPDLFSRLGQEEAVAALAHDYLAIAGWGLFPALAVMVLRAYLSALEMARIVLWVTLGSAGLNAVLNYALIFGHFGMPELGVQGAALASVGTHLAAAVGLAIYAVRRRPEHALFVRLWRPDRDALPQVIRLGWPIGLTNLAEVGLFTASSIMIGWIGATQLAAHGIALQLATASFMVHLGLSQAATVRAGRAYGRRDPDDLRMVALAALGLSALAACATVVLFLAMPGPLIRLFVDPAAPQLSEIVAAGSLMLAAAALFQLADAAQVMALGLLRGVQDTRWPMVFAALSYWALGAPVAYLLGFVAGWGGVGIWLGLAVGLAAAAVLMTHRFWLRVIPALGRPALATPG